MREHILTDAVAGGDSSVFLTSDGRLYASGLNSYGQLGDGTKTTRYEPVPVMSGHTMSTASVGALHTMFLTSGGEAYAAGRNNYGQLGDGSTTDRTTPVQVMSGYTVASIVAGAHHTVFMVISNAARSTSVNRQVYAVGWNGDGQLGDGASTDRSSPVRVMSAYKVTNAAAGGAHTVYLTSDGQAFATGRNEEGQLGDGTTTGKSTPEQVLSKYTVVKASAGSYHTMFLTHDGKVFVTGSNSHGQLGVGSADDSIFTPVEAMSGRTVMSMAAGYSHTLCVTSEHKVYAAGSNEHGQLGDGTSENRLTLVRVMQTYDVTAVNAGS
eukprot:gene34665-biopygen35230